MLVLGARGRGGRGRASAVASAVAVGQYPQAIAMAAPAE